MIETLQNNYLLIVCAIVLSLGVTLYESKESSAAVEAVATLFVKIGLVILLISLSIDYWIIIFVATLPYKDIVAMVREKFLKPGNKTETPSDFSQTPRNDKQSKIG